jgi:hypothetical protein
LSDIKRVVDAFGGAVSKSGKETRVICPHGHPYLDLREKGGTVVGFCRKGEKSCQEAVDDKIREALANGHATRSEAPTEPPKAKKPKPSELPDWQGLPASEYCRLKKFDRRLLEYLYNVRQLVRRDKPVLGWVYFDEDGKPLATKIRLSSNSHDCYFEPADPHVPFGLNNPNLKGMISKSYDLIVAEGETDCVTFASWGLAVIGISGAEGWRPEYADLPVVENAKRVLIARHNDEGGKKFAAKVLKDLPQAMVLHPPEELNDWNDIHIKYADFQEDMEFSQHPFLQHLDIAIQAGTLERATRQPKNGKPKPAPMRDEAFYGLAGKIVRLLEPVLETDRAAILSNVLGCSAILFKHSAHFQEGADIHYPNEYFMTVGNSAVSRKGMTTNAVVEVMERVRAGFKDQIIRGLSTGQGLIAALRKPDSQQSGENTEQIGEPIAPSVLVEISELAELLAVMKRDENTLSAVVRDAWDGKTLSVLTRKDPLKVKNVSLGTIAHITRAELLNKLTSTDRANGFANRFIFVWSERAKLLPHGTLAHLDYNEIIGELNAAMEAAEGRGSIERDEEAEQLWAEEYKTLTTRADTMVDVLLSRAEAHVLRLSLLYALLDSSPVIRKAHLKAALAVWDYAEETVQHVFGGAAEPHFRKIIEKLEGGPLTSGEIRRYVFSDHKSPEWVAEQMETLEQLRRVRRGQKEIKGGREVEAWFLV